MNLPATTAAGRCEIAQRCVANRSRARSLQLGCRYSGGSARSLSAVLMRWRPGACIAALKSGAVAHRRRLPMRSLMRRSLCGDAGTSFNVGGAYTIATGVVVRRSVPKWTKSSSGRQRCCRRSETSGEPASRTVRRSICRRPVGAGRIADSGATPDFVVRFAFLSRLNGPDSAVILLTPRC